MMYFFPLTLNIFWEKKNFFSRWLIYRGFLAVGKVGKRVRPVARLLTSEKDLFRRTNVWGPVSQRASAGMTSGWPLNNFLLTEREVPYCQGREFKKPRRLRGRKHHFKIYVWAILSISGLFNLVYIIKYVRSVLQLDWYGRIWSKERDWKIHCSLSTLSSKPQIW